MGLHSLLPYTDLVTLPTDPGLAQERLDRLASELERTWPDAAASLREGMDETLTLM